MTRNDHRDADAFDATQFDDMEWERATDDAAKLLLSDPKEFEERVLAEIGLDMSAADALDVLKRALAGEPQTPTIGQTLLIAYNDAIDRMARIQLESHP